MATKKQTPTVRLRRLAAELRRLRVDKGMSREVVTGHTRINHATLYRIEKAKSRPQLSTLMALMALYQVTDDEREYLMTLSKEAGQPGWLRPFHENLPSVYTAYISFEREAQAVRNYESLFVPGLLQTEDYARAVIRGTLPNATAEAVDDRLQARMERQTLLTQDQPLRLWAIIDEAALYRVVGNAAIMQAQIAHLRKMIAQPNVTVQMIPFGSGAHPGMPGSFSLISFPDPTDSDLVHIDSMAGDLFLDSEAEIAQFTEIFDHLRAVALSPDDSVTAFGRTAMP